MVILQFNKLIRNKWVWGAFAIIVSAAFCFDDMFTTNKGDERSRGDAGKLAGETVPADEFLEIVEDVRGFGQGKDWKRPADEVNRQAWEIYALLKVAEKEGIGATDKEVAEVIRHNQSFLVNDSFSFTRYQQVLRENGLAPERFERYLKRRLTVSRVLEGVLAAECWSSPAEIERAARDMTDVYTVRVATFEQSDKDAAAVKMGKDDVRKWYDEHSKELELPERYRLNFVKFDATNPELQAKMVITEDEMHDRYDVNIDKYTTTDTNGIETVRKFEEVKDELDKELRLLAAVQCIETNLNSRVYAQKAAAGSSRLEEIAKEESLKVEKTGYFALEGRFMEGFMKNAEEFFPGAYEIATVVSELDSESDDLRYGLILGENAVWLVEKAETSPAHVPTYEEAAEPIFPMVQKAVRADAFKASVEAVIAKGKDAVLAGDNVTTNITFSIAELRRDAFENQAQVARAATKLAKDEVSDFVSVAPNKALVVVCVDRNDGDQVRAAMIRRQLGEEVQMAQRRQLPELWQKRNLERLGFEPNDLSTVTPVTEE